MEGMSLHGRPQAQNLPDRLVNFEPFILLFGVQTNGESLLFIVRTPACWYHTLHHNHVYRDTIGFHFFFLIMTPISNIQDTGMFLLSVLYSYLRFEHIQKEKEIHYARL